MSSRMRADSRARARVICTFPEGRHVGGDRGRGGDRGFDYVTSKMPKQTEKERERLLPRLEWSLASAVLIERSSNEKVATFL